MNLSVRPKEECMFDAVSLGEVMLRLDPGEGRIRTARELRVWEGGGEYNVIRALHKCFGLKTSVVTAFADNEVGKLLLDLIEQGGVNTDFIVWKKTDGIGRTCRNGLNFTERGFGVRGAVGCSDRANTAISQCASSDFDFEKLFGTYGVRWFHTGGIYSSLSEKSAQTALDALRIAKKHGTLVSYDLNYRPSLWESHGGKEEAQKINRELVKYADVLFGNEEDFSACLGLELSHADKNFSSLNVDSYKEMLLSLTKDYPNLRFVASTLRTVKSASSNDWEALCACDGKIYQSKKYQDLEILDRVGGGDSFASGVIYGLLTGCDPETSINYGAAHGALAMTTPGDTSMASKEEVEALMKGAGARIIR